MPAQRRNCQRTSGSGVRGEYRALREPLVRVVSAHVDGDLTAQTVWPSDPANHQQHGELADLVSVQQVDANIGVASKRAHHRPQRPGRPPAAPNYLAEVIGMDAHLKNPAPAQVATRDPDVVGEVDDAPHQVVESLFEHVNLRSPAWPQPRRRAPQPPHPHPQSPRPALRRLMLPWRSALDPPPSHPPPE